MFSGVDVIFVTCVEIIGSMDIHATHHITDDKTVGRLHEVLAFGCHDILTKSVF